MNSDMSDLFMEDITSWSMLNSWSQGKEGGYAVRHGQVPARDLERSVERARRRFMTRQRDKTILKRPFHACFPGAVEGSKLSEIHRCLSRIM
jgi:hypothetical protein